MVRGTAIMEIVLIIDDSGVELELNPPLSTDTTTGKTAGLTRDDTAGLQAKCGQLRIIDRRGFHQAALAVSSGLPDLS